MRFMITIILFFLLAASALADGRVKRITVVNDQIVLVKTALGVATIIQVPDKPSSVVVGDTNAFKVEYLDTAITIKPLGSRAKSNLYIYTDYRRYNVQLVTGPDGSADYVVYLESPRGKKEAPPDSSKKNEVKWKRSDAVMRNGNLLFRVTRVGKTGVGQTTDGVIIEFSVTASQKEEIKPEWIWLTQGGVSRSIQTLAFSQLEVSGNHPVTGWVQIRAMDMKENLPLRIELRRKKVSFVTLPIGKSQEVENGVDKKSDLQRKNDLL